VQAAVSQTQTVYGGAAVIEGVMMLGAGRLAIAVRRPDGEIAIHEDQFRSVRERFFALRLPIVRGMVAFVEQMAVTINALLYSANQAAPDEEKLTKREMTVTTLIGLALALTVFVVIPTLLINWTKGVIGHNVLSSVLEGLLRVGIMLGYFILISRMKEIERVFQYHGAEHKVINAFESGDDLTVENVKRHSREHKRCGTSFVLYVVVIAIALFSLLNMPNVWLRVATRLALMPVIAGLAFEVIRMAGRHDNWLVSMISRPGLWLQGFTTREPDESQLEVAITAFESVRSAAMPR
jgi:uncharacterized protein YqhQ